MTKPFVWLYRVEDAKWIDPWDNPHNAIKVLELIRAVDAGTFPKNNGYYDYEARVVVHAESGRTWWKPQTIDYWGTERWVSANRPGERWIDRWSPKTRVLWDDSFPWSPDGQGCKVPEDSAFAIAARVAADRWPST